MIFFKYTKTDGAEYISHLDILRHIGRTFRRADIDIKLSEGFNPHMKIYMSAPMPIGVKSLCEYCAAESDFPIEEFKDRFNLFSPKGIKCIAANYSEKNPNPAGIITRAEYEISGVNQFDINEILYKKSIMITDNRGKEKEIRDRIISLNFQGSTLVCVLKCGNENLRADLFADYVCKEFGGNAIGIVKTRAFSEERALF